MPEPHTRQAELAQHGGEGNTHPDRLLTVRSALQRPTDRDQRAAGRHLAGERDDALGRYARNVLGPRSSLGDSIGFTEQIALEGAVPGGEPIEKIAVV